MLWIKRNLFLAAGGLLAVLLLGFGVFYLWTSRQKNKTIETQLEQNKEELRKLVSGKNPYPSPTNIARAREELTKVRVAITNARSFFQPIAFEAVTGQGFKSLLDSNLFELHRKAEETSVVLPSKTYAFTFAHQKTQLQFPPEAFPALPQQLAEIKRICEILFEAKVNKLIMLRRARLYTDEPVSQVDHHDMKPNVDEAMGMSSNPYELEFHAFSTELATVLEAFYKSTNGLVVKSVSAEIAPATGPDPNVPPITQPPVRVAPPPAGTGRATVPPAGTRPTAAAAPKPPEGLKTVLNEKLLRIRLVVDVFRMMPAPQKSAALGMTWNR